jgi:MFS family permease
VVAQYVRSLRPGLPRDVYVLQSGLVINAFGNGAGNPFIWIYLHNVRDMPLAVAGLAGSTSAACALLGAALGGSLADRRGARGTMIAGLVISALGWGLYPLVREPWHALALSTLTGSGIGIWLTLQSTVLALIVPRQLRHAAFAQQRVAANLGLGLGGFVGGLIVTSSDAKTFTTLFLLNAATFLVYSLFVARLNLPDPPPRSAEDRGYRETLRDRPFVRVMALNFVFVALSVALINAAFPVFAKNEAGVSEDAIGLFFLLNSLLIIGAQLPVARAIEGRRRTRGLALMCVLFAAAWMLVELGAVVALLAVGLIAAGVVVLSLGECLYDSIYGPLVADLAPDGKTARYMASAGLAWQLGFITAPLATGVLLGAAPLFLWPVVALVALTTGAYVLRLEGLLPPEARVTPRR